MNIIKEIKCMYYQSIYNKKKKEREKTRELAYYIGQFYVEKYVGDLEDYHKTRVEVQNLGISDLKIKNNIINIRLQRPGLLIGRRGSNLNELTIYLSMKYSRTMQIRIEEDNVLNCLLPYHPIEIDC